MAYNKSFSLFQDDALKATSGKSVALLCSSTVFGKPIPVTLRKELIAKFNSRPANVNGELIRFMILDQSFKEGIDLFDVRYVHIFEPQTTLGDEVQAVGRSTRMCGQKGLSFDPVAGWPLHVYRYDVAVPEKLRSLDENTLFELYMKHSKLNLEKLRLAAKLEDLAMKAAVDAPLTTNLHSFSFARQEIKGGAREKLTATAPKVKMNWKDMQEFVMARFKRLKRYVWDEIKLENKCVIEKRLKKKKEKKTSIDQIDENLLPTFQLPTAPVQKQVSVQAQAEIKTPVQTPLLQSQIKNSVQPLLLQSQIKNSVQPQLLQSQTPVQSLIKMQSPVPTPLLQSQLPANHPLTEEEQNNDDGNQDSQNNQDSQDNKDNKDNQTMEGGARVVKYTPSQQFIQTFFTPKSVYKGMLLWHSTGAGKTCCAIATTSKFEKAGYTILWVTRHTLKTDLWKNQLDDVCNPKLRTLVRKNKYLSQEDLKSHMSNRWFPPISYKQFTNLLQGKNDIYTRLAALNGTVDPLHKTLIVIDEAHKLYSPDLSRLERPNVKVLNEWIHKSYELSGKDSCRILLLSATPYTSEPFDLFRLINLCKDSDEAPLPETIEALHDRYGSIDNMEPMLDDLSGYISYVNMSRDVRHFAYPIFHDQMAEMSLDEVHQSSIVAAKGEITTLNSEIERSESLLKGLSAKKREALQDCRSKSDPKECVRQRSNQFADVQLKLKAKVADLKERRRQLKTNERQQKSKSTVSLSQETAVRACLSPKTKSNALSKTT